jgi:capsular exopolysaccharide synthesis family protein
MKDLQRIPQIPGQQVSPEISTPPLSYTARPAGEIPGAGFKRDYSGFLEYWQMIRRHPATVILLTMFGASVGFVATLPDARIYQAHASLEIQGLNNDFMNMKSVNPTIDASNNYSPDYDIQTQVKILQSRSLVKRVVAKMERHQRVPNLQPPDRIAGWRKALKINPPSQEALWQQAIGTAAGSVRVRSSGTNRIVDVSVDSTNAQVATDFVNTLAEEYINQNLEARWLTTEHTGEWLTTQLQDLKVKLEKAEEELQSYARTTGLVYTDEKNNVDDTKLADLQKQLSDATNDRVGKQSRYEMAKATPPGAVADVLGDSEKDSRTSLTELQAKLAQLLLKYTPKSPEVKSVQAQIDAIKLEHATAKQEDGSIIMIRFRNEYEAALRRENLLASAYATQAHLVSEKADEAAHYSLLKRDVDSSRLLYESMLQRLKEASIASALRASNVRVVDPAERPQVPYKPDVRRSIVMGLLTGLCAGVLIVVLRERADRTLQDPGDPAYYLSLAELGVVPVGEQPDARAIKKPAAQALLRIENGKASAEFVDERMELTSWHRKASMVAESFRTTLTSILFSGRNGERPRVLVFTSASPKEGKTTVVCNLGISLAEIHHNVLLIDADMRRPRLHSVFDVPNDKGLSDLLFEDKPIDVAMLEKACLPTAIPRLYVMPSGGSRHNASSLVHSPRLTELIKLARERFDTVVIDTPPMVNISDARVVARLADAVILVLRSAFTTRDAALLAKRRFAEDGIEVLGTILNYWNPKTPGYGYYRYYYSGYRNYYGKSDGIDANGNGNGNGNGHRRGVEVADSDKA